jgi:hypothetical protein
MPLSDDASLFVPYTVNFIPNREKDLWVAVQRNGDEIIYASPIEWPTEAEAERHAHDLNYLREKALESMTTTNLWLSVDIVSEGPDAVLILEKLLSADGRVAGWRLLQPAADEDNDAWNKTRESVLNAVLALSQEELPEDSESLVEHLQKHHDFDFDEVPQQPDTWYIRMHRELHDKGFDNATHTHEWNDGEWVDPFPNDEDPPAAYSNDEEVDDDASDSEEEGAREDADSG